MIVLVIQWLHVLLGIFWFGGSLYLNFMVVPVVLSLPLSQQREVAIPLGARSNQVLPLVALLVILLGLLRGIVWGPVHTFTFLFGTTYGVTFLISLVVASGVELWGHFVTGKAATQLNTFPLAEVMKRESATATAFNAQVQRVKLLALIELLGFFIIFTCMILMRFGL
jgi:branched-subunit amino acid ABC-type transport system permease component